MNNLYFTYRRNYTDRGVMQDVSFYNDKQYADHKESGLTEMIDGDRFIPNERITKEIVPGVKWLRKAGVLKYNPALDVEDLKATLLNSGGAFGLEIKTQAEMLTWVQTNTDLVETTPGTFLVHEANNDDLQTEDVYLTID